jgi:hypothetical protein
MATVRRLTAILAADVAGYSRLWRPMRRGRTNASKLLRLLIDPKIKDHRGHVVKNTGDGMLAEFASVVDALRCAAEVQRGMLDREPEAIWCCSMRTAISVCRSFSSRAFLSYSYPVIRRAVPATGISAAYLLLIREAAYLENCQLTL